MSSFSLTKTRFKEGVWQGILTSSGAEKTAPEIAVTLRDMAVPDVSISETPEEGQWTVEVPVPKFALGDGVQTFLIFDTKTGTVLESFTLIAGEVMGDDIRSEVELLRAELDMLKRAFRRHCVETM